MPSQLQPSFNIVSKQKEETPQNTQDPFMDEIANGMGNVQLNEKKDEPRGLAAELAVGNLRSGGGQVASIENLNAASSSLGGENLNVVVCPSGALDLVYCAA